MNRLVILFSLLLLAAGVQAQCAADFDFGTAGWGASPDASVGEQFDTAYVDVPYSDVFHVLVPIDASAIDPAFQLPLDSIILVNYTLIEDSGQGATLTFADLGLDIVCNNGGVSPNPCTFVGGDQYCAELTGTPNQSGLFAMTLEVQAWVTVFGVAVPQPYVFDGYVLTVIGPDAVDQNEANRFEMFPNPTHDAFQLNLPEGTETKRLLVRDLTGRLVVSIDNPAGSAIQMTTSDWSNGIYFVTLEGTHNQWTERLVVRH